MLLIYNTIKSPRLEYAFDVVFNHILGIDYKLISDSGEIKGTDHPLINYTNADMPDALQIIPYTALWDDEIKNIDPEVFQWNKLPVFFGTKASSIPFDPFAMVFFMVSRYEEYFCKEYDQHGRFDHRKSHAHRNNYLQLPLANMISIRLLKIINEKFQSDLKSQASYAFYPTFDIDIAYAHTDKGTIRAGLAFLKLIAIRDFELLKQRLKVNFGKMRDPFDNFDFILEILEKYKLKGRFFLLIGKYGKYDKNISYRKQGFRKLIKHLSDYADIGLHPSYGSLNNTAKIIREKERLEDIIGKEVSRSRQHYLRMQFPQTYNCLIEAGIKHDYSMGYSDNVGFRAGICNSYPFFDLEENREKDLRIHPFEFMDTAVMDNMNIVPEEFMDTVEPLIRNTQNVKGKLSGIWHNYDLSDNIKKHNTFVETIIECIK